jgi:hypothetical protein
MALLICSDRKRIEGWTRVLKRASASRSSGEWNDDDFDVLANGELSGRILEANAGRNEVAVKPFVRKSMGFEQASAFIIHKREFAMLRLLMGTVALAIVTLPASAQTTTPAGGGQVTAPSGQNSGAGTPGKPGSKSGPAAKPSSETTGSDMSDHNRAVRQQDSSKIPGQPGSKSGPSIRPPSEAK